MRALGKDATYSRLCELVDIFSHATLGAYVDYHSKNSAYLEELGVDHGRSMETMRLLSLCTLASASHILAYPAIAEALQVSDSQCLVCVCVFVCAACAVCGTAYDDTEFLVCDAPGVGEGVVSLIKPTLGHEHCILSR